MLAGVYYAPRSWNCFDWNSPRWTHCYIKKLLSNCCDLARTFRTQWTRSKIFRRKNRMFSTDPSSIQEETSGFLKEQLQKQRLRPGWRKKQNVECIDLKVNAKIGSINLKISSATRDITAFYIEGISASFLTSLRICKWMLIWPLLVLKIWILFLCTRI